MALTRIAQPNRWSAVYSPILYQFESSFATGYRIGSIHTDVNSNGSYNGFHQISFFSAHGVVAGDYVYLIGLNEIVRVISTPDTETVILDYPFDTANTPTGMYQYAYHYNASARVWAKISGVYTNVGTITTKPIDDGSTIVFTFDVSTVLKNYITSNIPVIGSTALVNAPDAFKEYYIEYREEYVLGDGGIPVYTPGEWLTDYSDSYYTINEKVAVNATEQYLEQIGETYKQKLYTFGTAGSNHLLLTNQPSGVEYCSDKKFWFYLNTEEIEAYEDITITINQHNGESLVATSTIDTSAILLGQNYFELSANTFTLDPSATTISIDVDDSVAVLTMNVGSCGCVPATYQLIWLNNKGGYSTYYFNGRATHGYSVDRIGQLKYDISRNFEPSNRQYGNLANQSRQTIILRNDTTNKEIQDWLGNELITSIDVYLIREIDGTEYLIPVTIDTNSITVRKDKEALLSLSFSASYAYDIITQTK